MTALQALAHSRSRSVGMSAKNVNTPEMTEALDFLEPHIRPTWLVRHTVTCSTDTVTAIMIERVNNRCSAQGLKAFRKSVRDLLKMRLDKLKRQFAAIHDIKVKKEIERLAKEYDKPCRSE